MAFLDIFTPMMHRVFCLFLLFSSTLNAQQGQYKNLFGDFGANVNTMPALRSINQLSNNQHVINTYEGSYSNIFSLIKYDSLLTPLWIRAYQGSQLNNAEFKKSIELNDKSIVSLGFHGLTNFFTLHSSTGNLLFNQFYGTDPNQSYYSHTICKSSEIDTSFVTLFAECAVKHGLTKINRFGNVVWSFEYSNNGTYNANVYTLDNAIPNGYISGGVNTGPVQDTTQYYGYLVVSNNNGSFRKALKYVHQNHQFNKVIPSRILKASNQYVVSFVYGNDYSGVWDYDETMVLGVLDTSLSLTKQWRFSSNNPIESIRFNSFFETSDHNLLVTGSLYNPSAYPTSRAFVFKFNPSAAGANLIWCKGFEPHLNPQSWLSTVPAEGLYTTGQNELIALSYAAHTDGSCISLLDQNGQGHCESYDLALNYQQVNDINEFSFQNNPIIHPLQHYPFALDHVMYDFQDTVFCNVGAVSLSEHGMDMFDILIKNEMDYMSLVNESETPTICSVFNSCGQLVTREFLDGFEQKTLYLCQSGLYFIQLSQEGQSYMVKFIIP